MESEAYLKPIQKSTMDHFCENSYQVLTAIIFAKSR